MPRRLIEPTVAQVEQRKAIAADMQKLIEIANSNLEILEGGPCVSEVGAIQTNLSTIERIAQRARSTTDDAFTVGTFKAENA